MRIYLELMLENLSSQGYDVQVRSVDYEFQKGANQMLRIRLPSELKY